MPKTDGIDGDAPLAEAGRDESRNPTIKSQVSDAVLVQKRRAQIVAAAVKLFSVHGYYRTTIQDIAREAGVSIGLIYQYVKDKDDVLLLSLLDVLETYKREIPRALEGLTDPLVRFKAAVDAYCRVVDSRREAGVLNYRSTKSLPRERREIVKQAEIETNQLIAACIQACIEAGLFRACNVELVTYHCVMLAHSWALKYWRLKELCTLDGYIKEGLEFILASLLTPKGRQHAETLAGSR